MKRVKKIAAYLFLTVASVISVFPLYWMISAATNNSTDVLGGRLLPGLHLIENYKELILQQNVGRSFGNSMFYSCTLSLLSLLVCSIAGYGFEVYHDKWKDTVMSILLLAMMVPFAATLIPCLNYLPDWDCRAPDRLYSADNLHAVSDHAVQTEHQNFPAGDHRGSQN